MTIAFFGDSFSKDNEGYPSRISKHFNCSIENYSQPAASALYTYQQLCKRFSANDLPDVAIITITHSDRLYHDKYLIRSNGAVDKDFNPAPTEVNDAVDIYYSKLFSTEGSKLMHDLYCKALAQFSLGYPSTKFVFLPCFDSFTGSMTGNYAVTGPRLMNYAEMDMEIHMKEFEGAHLRNNHLNDRFNKNLANIIIRELERYRYGKVKHVDILGDMML